MTEVDLPVGVKQDIEKCIEELPAKDRALIRGMSEGELIRLHHGFGTGLRNRFRQNKLPNLCKFCSEKVAPEKLSLDAISALAIREIWLHLRSNPP